VDPQRANHHMIAHGSVTHLSDGNLFFFLFPNLPLLPYQTMLCVRVRFNESPSGVLTLSLLRPNTTIRVSFILLY